MKALIVDDGQESRLLLGRILSKSFSAKIVEAKNGKDALRMIPSENPDIVFLDYEMPSLNGKETLKAIRFIPEYKNLPVVIVTSHSERELVREFLAYKVSGNFMKPLDTDYIVKLMSSIYPKSK